MGGKTSCISTIDDIKLKLPIAECFMKHCSSSCVREAEEDVEAIREAIIREVELAVIAADIREVEEAALSADLDILRREANDVLKLIKTKEI